MSRSDDGHLIYQVGPQLAPGNWDLGTVSITLMRLVNTVKIIQAAWFMVCARKVVSTCSAPNDDWGHTVSTEVSLYTVFHTCYHRSLLGVLNTG